MAQWPGKPVDNWPGEPADQPEQEAEQLGGVAKFMVGAGQGLLNYPEEAARLLEHATGRRLVPESMRKRAREYRRLAAAAGPTAGAGEFAGGLVPTVLPLGALARAATPFRAAQQVRRGWQALPLPARAAATAAGWGTLQPSDPTAQGGDYWRQEAEKAGLSGLFGYGLGKFAQTWASRAANRLAQQQARRASEMERVQRNLGRTFDYQQALRDWETTTGAQDAAHAAAKREYDLQSGLRGAAEEAANRAYRRPADFAPVNLDWYRYTMQPTDIAPPTKVGREALGQMYGQIGNLLNNANSRLQFVPDQAALNRLLAVRQNVGGSLITQPERDAWFGAFETFINRPIQEFGALSGADYSRFITGLRETADRFAAGGNYQAARGLTEAKNVIEAAASGPSEALAMRQSANEAYRRFAILRDATGASRGYIATPSQLAKAWEQRSPNQYMARPDPMKDWLEQQRQRLEVRDPERAPVMPSGPAEPVKPTAAPRPEKPEMEVARPDPNAPAEPASKPGRFRRMAGRGAAHAALWALGGPHSWFVHRTLGDLAAEVAGRGDLGETIARAGESPARIGVIAGRIAPVVGEAGQSLTTPAEAAEEESGGGAGVPSNRREPLRIGTIHPDYY